MIFAVVLVYLLMAVNFQSWLDPFIILMALPGALAGIVWMLFITQTTFSVPSLMGTIMCIGVATANSILMVVFANDQREEGMDARRGAGGRPYPHPPRADDGPAMIIGMLPMALGWAKAASRMRRWAAP
jgi:Cu/Ag efflux pump CusA